MHRRSRAVQDTPAFELHTARADESWRQIVQQSRSPDVEILVRYKNELQRRTIQNSNEVCTEQRALNNPVRAFRIASLTKFLINLAFCIYLIDKNSDTSTRFDTPAFDDYGGKYRLNSNPTIEEVLLHIMGFAPMNRSLISLCGTFMFSNSADFIRHAVILTDSMNAQRSGDKYSSANHIFAALLLEQLTGMSSIAQVLETYIFKPFGMEHTTLCKKILESLVMTNEIELIPGYTADGHLHVDVPIKIPEDYRYMSNSLEQAFLGGWSTVEVLDKMFTHLMKALHDKDALSKYKISQKAAQKFFELSDGFSLAGMRIRLDNDKSFVQSQNKFMSYPGGDPLYSFGTYPETNDRPWVYYQAGAMTGAALTMCMDPEAEMFFVAYANLAAPIDVTAHLASLFLQDYFYLVPDAEIQAALETKREEITALFNARHLEDHNALTVWSTDVSKFIGVYKDEQHDQTITIAKEGTLTLSRGHIKSLPLPVRSKDGVLRIVPDGLSFIIDRHGEWSDLEFRFDRKDPRFLETANKTERYCRKE